MRYTLLVLALWVTAAWGDGILVPEPPIPHLAIRHHRVAVTIDGQAAHTEIDQAFLNHLTRDIEGTYLFPLPAGASFSAFSMLVDGEPLSAEVLDADAARRLYEEIVRQRIDPALLEYVGQGAYRARIYPIPASGEKRVQLAYDELLSRDAGVVCYRYPLNTEKFSPEPLEDVSVTVDISSAAPIKAVYSPSHPVVVKRNGEYSATVVYADEEVLPTQDFLLYYTVAREDVGVDLVTYMPADEQPGYYMLLAAPQVEPATDQLIPKRMVFTVDRSGSMAGEKMEQARAALRYAINHLHGHDQVNVVDYATTVTAFAESTVTASAATREALLEYVDGLEATGGTDIHGALMASLKMLRGDDYAEMVVFLTDGKPTIGERDLETILADVDAVNTSDGRIFVFGVGHEVNTHLLDRLAGGNGGATTYVEPGEDIQVAVSAFHAKVSSPVMENLQVELEGARRSDYYPHDLPDLFSGSQAVQLGRLSGPGSVQVVLSGQVQGTPAVFRRQVQVSAGGTEYLPRLWATRKVGFLLDEIRLHGEEDELVDAIVKLSKRYGIITPYTSFLIVEDDMPAPTLADETFRADSGAGAVAASETVKSYAAADNTVAVRSAEVRYAGDKTFYRRDGVWQDSQFDASAALECYAFGTSAYFDLVAREPQLGPYLALGQAVDFTAGSSSYRIREAATAVEGKTTASLPSALHLAPNHPNPFNASTQIEYHLDVGGPVTLAVFDLQGRRVATLVQEYMAAGTHRTSWNGTERDGVQVASGVYICRLTAGAQVASRKLMLLK